MSLDDAWMKFMIEGSDSVEIDEIVPKIIPECGPIVISTKTKILYFNISVDLNYIFWKLSMISYDYMGEGIIKKQMKFNFQDRESVQEFEDNIKDIKLPIDIKILNQFENPNGRIKFKDVRKVSIGLSKKDVINYKKKSKSAFYNCFVIIYRIMFKGKYKEIHLKLFNSGKIEIPGIQDDCILDIAVQKIIDLLQPFYNYIIHEDICKRQTILVNSNFNCNYYIHRENLFRILKKEYSIKCSFDSCSYPGIQCKYKLSNQQEISFMIFRTGSILIVGKCENEDLYKIYEYIKTILNNHFSEIYQQNTIAKVIKPKKKYSKLFILRKIYIKKKISIIHMSEEIPIPSQKVLVNACKLACKEDKPIMMDYWVDSHNSKVLIGVRENDEKMLVRSEEEYTSPISKIFKVAEEYIIMTENSIYLVSSKIPSRKIN